jgi:hypothetical protein
MTTTTMSSTSRYCAKVSVADASVDDATVNLSSIVYLNESPRSFTSLQGLECDLKTSERFYHSSKRVGGMHTSS